MGAFTQSNSLIYSIWLIIIGALISYLLISITSPPLLPNEYPKLPSHYRNNYHHRAFYLGVVVTFPNISERERFVSSWTPLAKYVKEQEIGTLSYELLYSERDPLRILINERYETKEYYLKVHKSSAEFLTFRKKFDQILKNGAVVDGHSYNESGIGFP